MRTKTFTWSNLIYLYSVNCMPFRNQKLSSHKWIIIDCMGNGFVRKSSHCWSPVFPLAYKSLKTLIFLLQASNNTGFSSTLQTTHHLPQVVSEIRIVFSASRAVFWHCPKNVLKNAHCKNIINRSSLNCSAKKVFWMVERDNNPRNKYLAGITWAL